MLHKSQSITSMATGVPSCPSECLKDSLYEGRSSHSSDSEAQSEVWVQCAGNNSSEGSPAIERVSSVESGHPHTSFASNKSDETQVALLAETSQASTHSRTYVSFEDVCAGALHRAHTAQSLSRVASKEPPKAEVIRSTSNHAQRSSGWRAMAGHCARFFGRLSDRNRRQQQELRYSSGVVRGQRWRQCLRRTESDQGFEASKIREILNLQDQLQSERIERLRAQEEVQQLQESLQVYRKMADVAMAQRRTCTMFLNQSLQENKQLTRQLEDQTHVSDCNPKRGRSLTM